MLYYECLFCQQYLMFNILGIYSIIHEPPKVATSIKIFQWLLYAS